MDWGDLRDLATGFVHRKDIPWDKLQPLACADMSITLIVQENEASVILTLSGPDNKSLYSTALPTDYARIRSVWQGGILNPVDIKTLQEFGGRNYAISGNKIFTPKAAAVDVVYSAQLEPLANDTDSSAILLSYPNVYLYALLKQAAIWMQDVEINDGFFEKQFLGACQTANSNYLDAAFGPGLVAQPMGGRI